MDDLHLKHLSPDIRFERLIDDEEALAFTFAAKENALGPHIRARWGWGDAYQREVHYQRLAEKPFFAIVKSDIAVGTLSWMPCATHIRFGEFYLFSQFQKQGLGTLILQHLLEQADALHCPVRLEYLKWNPVGSLYARHGFEVTGETDNHILLERRPTAK